MLITLNITFNNLLITVNYFLKEKNGKFRFFYKQKPQSKKQIFNSFFLAMLSALKISAINNKIKKVMSYNLFNRVVNNCEYKNENHYKLRL